MNLTAKTLVVSACKCLLIALLAASLSCSRTAPKRPVVSEPLADSLRDWKQEKRIALTVKDARLKEVLAELQRQSGVKMEVGFGDTKISLALKDVPLWTALAETSIQSKVPIWVYRNEIHFSEIADYVYDPYQIIGPFFFGVHSAPDLLPLGDDQKSPGLVVHAGCLPNEAHAFPGISGAALETADGKRHSLKSVVVDAKSSPQRAYFEVPAELLGKKAKLRATFAGEVYTNHREFIVPAVAGHVAKFADFDGITITTSKVTDDGVEYVVEWDWKLRGKDAEDARTHEKSMNLLLLGKTVSERQRLDLEDWMAAKLSQMRLLHVVENELLDTKRTVLENSGKSHRTGFTIEAKIDQRKGEAPQHIKIVLAERRLVSGFVEFDDLFSEGKK